MGVQIGATKGCLIVQQSLDDIAAGNIPTLRIENFGSLQWLTSSMNTTGFEGLQVQDPGGKNRTVKIGYWTNPRTAAGTDCTPNICTPGSTTGQKFAEFVLNYCRDVSLTLDEQEFRDFCGTEGDTIQASDFAKNQMQGVVNQLLAGISTDAVTYINAHAGNFYGGVAGPKTVIMLKADGSPYHGAELTVAADLEDAGFVGTPGAIGLGYLRTYSKTLDIACCNSTGIDMSKMSSSTWGYFSDRRVDTVIGTDNNFFVLAPGSVQLVSKVKWVGPYEDIGRTNEVKTTVNIPIPGGGSLPVDFTAYRNFCGTGNDGLTKWKLTWSVNFDFFSLPSDVEAVGSNWRSVNGIFHYKAICGTPTCADVNS